MNACLVSCSNKKHTHTMKAKDIYSKSALFRRSSAYANSGLFDKWFILSAKHGLLLPEAEIAPYDLYLGDYNKDQRIVWGAGAFIKLRSLVPDGSKITILASKVYVDALTPYLVNKFEVCTPLKSKRIGEQLQWLIKQTQ